MARRVWDETLIHHRRLYVLFDKDSGYILSIHTSFNNAVLRKHRLASASVDISSVTKRELELYYTDDKTVEDYLRRHSI